MQETAIKMDVLQLTRLIFYIKRCQTNKLDKLKILISPYFVQRDLFFLSYFARALESFNI